MSDPASRPPLAQHEIGILVVDDDALLRMELMRTQAATIEAEERIAGYLASVADWADAMGETGVADGLSDRARGHHVKVITQRARLGALV